MKMKPGSGPSWAVAMPSFVYESTRYARPLITSMERTETMGSRGMPPILTLAGEFLYRSGRRKGKARAATLTQRIVITPANTPIESSVAKELESTDHARMAATMMEAVI